MLSSQPASASTVPPSPLPFPPEVINYQLAHPDEYCAGPLLALGVAGICIVFVAVALRFWGRRLQKIPLLADDWTLLGATFLSCGAVVMLLIKGYRHGFGKHYATLSPEMQLKVKFYDYPFNLLYTTGYPLSRISLVLLYRRVFESRRWFLNLSLVLIIMFVGYMIGTVVADIVTDIPIAAYWDHSIKPIRAIDGIALYVFNVSFNIATDLLLLILPNFIIWRLGISCWQRIGLSAIFSLGALTLIASVLRLIYFFRIKVYDISYTLVPFAVWTAVELFMGILCPCLVTLGPLISKGWQLVAFYTRPLLPEASRRSRDHNMTDNTIGRGSNGKRYTKRHMLEQQSTIVGGGKGVDQKGGLDEEAKGSDSDMDAADAEKDDQPSPP